MPILPIDLQTLFSNLNQVSKDQAVLKEVPPEQQILQGTQIAKTTLEKDNLVNETEVDDGSEAIKDQEAGSAKEHGKNKKKKEKENKEEKKEDPFQDPDLGQHIDIVRVDPMLEILLIVTLVPAGFFIVYVLLKRQLTRMFRTASLLDDVQQELDKMIIEMNRITDRNVGLMEDKVGQLSSLLADTEKRIAGLKREHEKYTVVKDLALKLEKANAKKPGNGKSAGIQDEVIALRNEGFTAQVIAGKLDLPMGEVELILSLKFA